MIDHERSVLGAVLADNAALGSVEQFLRAEHFGDSRHRMVYAAMASMSTAGRVIDLVTLHDELGDAVDAEYLAGLVDGMPRVANVAQWGRIVREHATLRALASIGKRLELEAGLDGAESRSLVERLQAACSKLSDQEEHGIRRLGDLIPEAIRSIDAFVDAENGVVGIPTGLTDLDRVTCGLKAGELWVIGACPSRGKSALVLQIAIHAAMRGKRVLVFSMEMPPVAMVARAMFHHAEVDKWDLRSPAKRSLAWDRLRWAKQQLEKLPVDFDSRPSPTVAQIRAAARQHHQRHGMDLVVVDYLQRCTLPEGDEMRQWIAVGDVAKQLKTLAQSLNLPVLTACQLRMDAAMRRPGLGDLAQARQVIAAEADLIGFLHPAKPEEFQKLDLPEVSLCIDKQRDGATGEIPLLFHRAWVKFVSTAQAAAV